MPQPANNPRVLVIQDDAVTSWAIERALHNAGYHVETTDCAEEGISRALRHRYDALLVDDYLPDTDGFTLVRLLHAQHIAGAIIMVGSSLYGDQAAMALAAGATHVCTLPFKDEHLLDLLRPATL